VESTVINLHSTNGLKDNQFREIRDYIYEKSGLFFADHKKYLLENRISKRIDILHLKDYEEYMYLLKYGSDKIEELGKLFDAVTTNETYFFRNEPQLKAFRAIIIPQLVKKLSGISDARVKIWSAGCSSGEEPYTISIIFQEEAFKGRKIPYEILASDISREILDKAKRGIYGKYSMRNITNTQIVTFFSKEENKHKIKENISRPILHKIINLAEPNSYPFTSKFDLIFCRNVLIYFDEVGKKEVIKKFYDLLNPGGYLFIGHSESLHGISDSFRLIHFEKALAYRKE